MAARATAHAWSEEMRQRLRQQRQMMCEANGQGPGGRERKPKAVTPQVIMYWLCRLSLRYRPASGSTGPVPVPVPVRSVGGWCRWSRDRSQHRSPVLTVVSTYGSR